MSIITISRGSYSYGKEIAEKSAVALNYDCISREVLLEASEQFHVPEIKLVHAVHDSPTILDRFTHGKERYITYIRAALLKHLQQDNIVYHGFAGHFFLSGISHVLKVRVIADLEKRVQIVMKRDHVHEEQALRILKKDDEERRKWSLYLYGMDPTDARLYDFVFHIDKLTVEDAVDMIATAARQPAFQKTEASQKKMDELTNAAIINAELIDQFPTSHVTMEDGKVTVDVKCQIDESQIVRKDIEATIERTGLDVQSLQVNIVPYVMDVKF